MPKHSDAEFPTATSAIGSSSSATPGTKVTIRRALPAASAARRPASRIGTAIDDTEPRSSGHWTPRRPASVSVTSGLSRRATSCLADGRTGESARSTAASFRGGFSLNLFPGPKTDKAAGDLRGPVFNAMPRGRSYYVYAALLFPDFAGEAPKPQTPA
jgi:hypothetical protein